VGTPKPVRPRCVSLFPISRDPPEGGTVDEDN